MSCEYGKDSTLNAELLHPRAQLVKCCACSLLRWGLQMYLSVLNIRSSSTDPGTNTITNSATFTHSPNLSRAPKRVALLQQRLEHACKLGEQLGVICLCCALNCCVVCTLVQLPLPAYQGLLLLQPCCCFILVTVAALMPCNGLLPALEYGWADAAASLVPIPFVHPPITQPIFALGLSLRGWMLKPLSLELVCGPMAP